MLRTRLTSAVITLAALAVVVLGNAGAESATAATAVDLTLQRVGSGSMIAGEVVRLTGKAPARLNYGHVALYRKIGLRGTPTLVGRTTVSAGEFNVAAHTAAGNDLWRVSITTSRSVDVSPWLSTGYVTPRRTDSITIVPVTWSGAPALPSTTQLVSLARQTAGWYSKVSGGVFQLSWPRVTATAVIARQSDSACMTNLDAITSSVVGRVGEQNAAHVVYVLPCAPSGEAGLGDQFGNQVWLFAKYGTSTEVLAHEIGHNLGLQHANTVSCWTSAHPTTFGDPNHWALLSQPDPSNGCRAVEYADPLDVMGNAGLGSLSAAELQMLGWLLPSERRTVTASTTVTINTLSASPPTRSPRSLVIERGSLDPLYVEFRTPVGLDARACSSVPTPCGVQIRVSWSFVGFGGSNGPGLYDATPDGDFSDPSLPVGSSVTTPDHIRITNLGQSATQARIQVTYGAPAPTVPSAPSSASAVVGTDTSTAVISWSRPADNGAAILKYVVTCSDGTSHTVISDGGSTTQMVYPGLVPGVHETFVVSAVNERGASTVSPAAAVN